MATLSQAIYATLTSAVSATTAVGKVYPRAAVAQNATLPYVVYFRVSGSRESMVGRGSANHARARYQVTVYSATQLEAESIINAVLVACRTAHTSPIKAIDADGGPYDLPEPIDGRETMCAAVAADLSITYKEH